MGLVGFYNVSSNCYMNVCLQGVMCVEDVCKDIVRLREDGLWNKMCLVCEGRLEKGGVYNSLVIKEMLGKYSVFFRLNGQQDAHECWVSMVDVLHEKSVEVSKGEVVEMFSMDREDAFGVWRSVRNSLVKYWYYGMFVNYMQCVECRYVRHNYEVFNNISSFPGVSVLCMLREYMNRVELEGVECEGCKRRCRMVKLTEIFRFPMVLVVHVKRYDVSVGGYGRNNMEVGFEFMLNFGVGGRVYEYELVCIINHIGNSPCGGHYMACSKYGSSWYMIDDDRIQEVKEEMLSRFKKNVYMLFYRLRGITDKKK